MKIKVFLILLVLIGFFLRSFLLPSHLFFGPEQGIDFLVVRDIVINHKFTLIGAKTDISGIFHGPLYYYLATIPFFLSGGNPLFIAYFFIAIASFTIILVYQTAKEITGKSSIGLISAVLYTVSFGAIVYSRWLSSHPLSIPFACLFFLSLQRFLKGDRKYIFVAAISYALLGQVELLNFIFFGAVGFLIMLFYRKSFFNKQNLLLIPAFFLTIVLSFGNFLFFDLRHEFLIAKNITKLLTGSTGFHVSMSKSLMSTFSLFHVSFASFLGLVPSLITEIIIVLFFLVLIKYSIKNNYYGLILIWLIAPLLVLTLLRHDVLEQFFVGLVPAVIIGVSILVGMLWERRKIAGTVILLAVVLINLYALFSNLPTNHQVFFQSTQPDLRYSDEIAVIDKIYSKTNGRAFSFQSYTIPYWTQQGWQYLFWYVGTKKFGYLPSPEKDIKLLYVIIQDDPSTKWYQDNWLKNTESKWGILTDSFRYGILKAEERAVD